MHLTAALAESDPSALLPARWQMTITLGSHIMLACFGVAFPAMIFVVHRRGLRDDDAVALGLAQRSSKVAAVLWVHGGCPGAGMVPAGLAAIPVGAFRPAHEQPGTGADQSARASRERNSGSVTIRSPQSYRTASRARHVGRATRRASADAPGPGSPRPKPRIGQVGAPSAGSTSAMGDHQRQDQRGSAHADDPPAHTTSEELEEAKRQDLEAPALGAVDDGTEFADPPEPQEPG